MAAIYNITESANELEIRIRHTKRSEIPLIVFMLIWLTGWFFGEVFALISLFDPGTMVPIRIFLVIWVIPWTIGGGFAMLKILKMLGGIELIQVGRGMIRITRSFFLLKITKRYDVFKITDLHTLAKDPGKFSIVNSGLIQFSYEGKDVRFGSGLSKTEKSELFNQLKEHRDLGERNFR